MNTYPEECFHLGIKALLCDSEGNILLLERAHPIKGMYWDLPGGRLQKGETVLDTLQREVEEETGLKNLERAVLFDMILTTIRISSANGEVGLILSIYRCNIDAAFEPRLSIEHTGFGWFSFSKAAQLLKIQYPAVFIEKIANMKIEYRKNLPIIDNPPTSL